MAKIIVGMSGGVDSAVAAYLLRMAGHDVFGVTLRTWLGSSRCCEIDDARRVCDMLQIPYYAVNCAAQFREMVTKPFVNSYLRGLTPNPCVECNRYIKWEQLMESMTLVGAEYIATGHYASVVRLENGRYTVKKAASAAKDQTYMLYKLTQEQLARTIMPLGALSKDEVRLIAEKAGLPVAQKKDSQEICFVTDGDYADFVCSEAQQPIPPEGDFVDTDGNVLGRHSGIIHYTIGQRKGLGIALGYPAYVKNIDPVNNRVVLARDEELYCSNIECSGLNFMSIEGISAGENIRALVRIRYHNAGEWATIESHGEDRVSISFDSPVRAPAPGQAAVFYDENDLVIGGGEITDN